MSVDPQIKYRLFEKADLERLRPLIWNTIEVSYQADYPPAAIAFFKQFHSEDKIVSRAATGTVLVAETDGRLVATASLAGAEIFAVFVDPAHQGKGYGRQLMLLLEDMARASGIEETHLSVSLPSRTFYEGLGYDIIEERIRTLEGGELLRFWSAKKNLTARTR